jgi:two-component system, sensor histidine kinase LadS
VVSTCAPEGVEFTPEGEVDEQRVLQRMGRALDLLVEDPRKVVHHLDAAAPGQPASVPA